MPHAKAWAESYKERLARAKASILAAQDRQKAYADRNRQEVRYEVGQQVLLSTKNIKFKGEGVPKLMPKWMGPLKKVPAGTMTVPPPALVAALMAA